MHYEENERFSGLWVLLAKFHFPQTIMLTRSLRYDFSLVSISPFATAIPEYSFERSQAGEPCSSHG